MLSKLKAVLVSVWADICDTYKRVKVYVIAILAVIAIWEWQKIKAVLLVKFGQKQIDSANKQDQKLATQEAQENQQADALVKKSGNEPAEDDWYQK